MSPRGEDWVNRIWYGDSIWYLPLVPLSWLYATVTRVRRLFYRIGLLSVHKMGVPVIVIGNITVGGTGKTPLTVLIVQGLRERGYSPGIVSRGYRGNIGSSPLAVTADSDPLVVGDEPILLARRGACPVVVHPDRVAAAKLLQEQGVDVIIADDGLQHYRLARDVEIAVVDGARAWGNGRLLPAGPLREPVTRLRYVNHIAVQTDVKATTVPRLGKDIPVSEFTLEPLGVQRMGSSESRPLESFKGKRVHAVAAIGNPGRFFDLLKKNGIDVMRHPLPDHATLTTADITFDDHCDVIMTEKDAVKCSGQMNDNTWYVPVEVVIANSTGVALLEQVGEIINSATQGHSSS